jgi:penicillin G amidase
MAKKFLKWLAIVLGTITVVCVTIFFIWKWSVSADYSGGLSLPGLKDEVKVRFDDFGIPYIYAANPEDLYFVHGYLHARERLFQMDMMRRVGSGRLAEVLGPDLISTDAFFHKIGLVDYAKRESAKAKQSADSEWYRLTERYLAGVNYFVETGFTPVEYRLAGMEKMPFSIEDCYAAAGYMAFGFALGQKTDPLAQELFELRGHEILEELGLYYDHSRPAIPAWNGDFAGLRSEWERALAAVPVPPLIGSNAWAVSGQHTDSGGAILCNDTHIAHGVPNVWYEAYLECPGFSFMGNYLAGIPFALLGHNPQLGWGVTMLEEDDMDFYVMLANDSLPGHYFHQNQWKKYAERTEVIRVKGRPDTSIVVRTSDIGPVVNEAFEIGKGRTLSMYWTYLSKENELMETFFRMNNAANLAEFEAALKGIHGPGLNINYADADGNIGWWACAALAVRKHDRKLFVPGTGEFDITGHYPFSQNPRSVNPPWGYIYSANNQICMSDSIPVEGYYAPPNRAQRVRDLLDAGGTFNPGRMKAMQTDVNSPIDSAVCAIFKEVVGNANRNESENKAFELLTWDGNHELEAKSPLLYYKMLYHTMRLALEDEVDKEWFESFLGTHWFKNAYSALVFNPTASVWDDRNTEARETRDEMIVKAFRISVASLEKEFGGFPLKAEWRDAHTIEMKHPFGIGWPVKSWLNIGPKAMPGGYETVNQTGFRLSPNSKYPVTYGPQIRLIVDFSNPQLSWNILPCGQSGNVFSRYYDDQFEMYVRGEYRERQTVDNSENRNSVLIFKP